jgi:CheY-like chemotaxis protein
LFTLLGYEARTAYSGPEAIEAATVQRPDVILLDLHMPLVDGFETAQEIGARYPSSTPLIVAVSAAAGPHIDKKLRSCGFDHYVTKPADVHHLVALIQICR